MLHLLHSLHYGIKGQVLRANNTWTTLKATGASVQTDAKIEEGYMQKLFCEQTSGGYTVSILVAYLLF